MGQSRLSECVRLCTASPVLDIIGDKWRGALSDIACRLLVGEKDSARGKVLLLFSVLCRSVPLTKARK